MKSAPCLIGSFVLLWTLPLALRATPFTVTDDFVTYLESATNPNHFGLKADGRFYPYSTPHGRRIGFDQPVQEIAYYTRGWPKAEAEKELRASVARAVAELERRGPTAFTGRSFDALGRKSQEMLVDFALSNGADDIPPAFLDAVAREDWDGVFASHAYIRWVEKGWPDNTRNKAFADRWLPTDRRQRPAAAGGAEIADDFVAYLKRTGNPEKKGRRADGRFYAYASGKGECIGYGLPLEPAHAADAGISPEDADWALVTALQRVADELRRRVRPAAEYDQLPPASREILLDFGLTEGVAALTPEFIRTVVALDWNKILTPEFYTRRVGGIPDADRNGAFLQRWARGSTR